MSDPPQDDEEEQRRRAERLREQIDKLKSGEDAQPDEGEENPRDFIERKMREERENGEQ